jgi:hypothetical protein
MVTVLISITNSPAAPDQPPARHPAERVNFSLVLEYVVYAEWRDLAKSLDRKIAVEHFNRIAMRLVRFTVIFELANILFLFCVNR